MRRHMRYEGVILELIWSPYMIWRLLFGRYGDFSIWSSSISAAASNSQAMPHIVVEMELLASYQYGGPNSIFIYQLRVGPLLVRAPDHLPPSMPPLPPPPSDDTTAAAAGPIQRPPLSPYRRGKTPTWRSYSTRACC